MSPCQTTSYDVADGDWADSLPLQELALQCLRAAIVGDKTTLPVSTDWTICRGRPQEGVSVVWKAEACRRMLETS
jgi:hypothetical protein